MSILHWNLFFVGHIKFLIQKCARWTFKHRIHISYQYCVCEINIGKNDIVWRLRRLFLKIFYDHLQLVPAEKIWLKMISFVLKPSRYGISGASRPNYVFLIKISSTHIIKNFLHTKKSSGKFTWKNTWTYLNSSGRFVSPEPCLNTPENYPKFTRKKHLNFSGNL